jgi:hypothetical protein
MKLTGSINSYLNYKGLIMKDIQERFNKRYEVDSTTGCWVWQGGKTHIYACHLCNNTKCVNPDHLYEGSPLDNARDREEFGNTLRGRKLVPRSQETKDKISAKLKGIPLSEETKAKMKGRISPLRGIPLSDETKSKISDSNKGRTPWNKGVTGYKQPRTKQ